MVGRFISFEGGEGRGKSTHAARLAERLRAQGVETVLVREPGGTEIGEKIRGILKDPSGEAPVGRAELLLFLAARAQLVERVIRPALARGAWVVSDRFSDSTLAYQGYGRGIDLAAIRAANDLATGGLVPDCTILLVTGAAEAVARVDARGARDRFERAGADFHARLARGFEELAAAEPARFRRIDSSGSMDETAEKVWTAIRPLI